jgi:hypothetical protein
MAGGAAEEEVQFREVFNGTDSRKYTFLQIRY